MPISGKKMIKLYIKAGWTLDRINGSHHIMKKEHKTASIPVHKNKDLSNGLERALLKELNK